MAYQLQSTCTTRSADAQLTLSLSLSHTHTHTSQTAWRRLTVPLSDNSPLSSTYPYPPHTHTHTDRYTSQSPSYKLTHKDRYTHILTSQSARRRLTVCLFLRTAYTGLHTDNGGVEVQQLVVDVDVTDTTYKVLLRHLTRGWGPGETTQLQRSRQVQQTMTVGNGVITTVDPQHIQAHSVSYYNLDLHSIKHGTSDVRQHQREPTAIFRSYFVTFSQILLSLIHI